MNSILLIIYVAVLAGFALLLFFVYRYYEDQLKKELSRAQKSEQLKSVFLANVSHSLRTPLNSILGYTNLILVEDEENMHASHVHDLASIIHADCQQLLDFISQLLELSNFEGSMPSFTQIEVNLAELMASYRREALNLVTNPEVSVMLRTDLSPHCKATLDTNFMHQLMMHLLTEAVKQTTKGDIIVNFRNERHGLKVSITYGGTSQSDLLNDDFYTYLQQEDSLTLTKYNSRLGFSICRAIIDAIGGELDLEVGNGIKSTATFWFPCRMRDMNRKRA